MQARLADIRALGGELVAVTQSQTETLAEVLRSEPRPFPFLADPGRDAYRAFGLGRGGLKMFFRPRVLAHYLRKMAGGYWPQGTRSGEDVYQLGGDFVLDGKGNLVLAHRSVDPIDRPAVDELLDALKACSQTSVAC